MTDRIFPVTDLSAPVPAFRPSPAIVLYKVVVNLG